MTRGAASAAAGGPLIGTWTDNGARDGCVRTLAFDAASAWEANLLCAISHTTVGVQTRLGTYEIRADELLTALEHSSCPTDLPRLVSSRFAFAEGTDELSLVDEDGAAQTLQRSTPGPTDADMIIEQGCFLDDGTFEPHPIANLRAM